MDRTGRQLSMLLLAASVFQGCVSIHAPLEADDNYPPYWGEMTTLGPNCSSLDGAYLNEGVITAANGAIQPVLLTSVLNIRSNARIVSLSVRTRRLDKHGDAFVSLDVAPDNNVAELRRFENCFCIRGTLACPEVSPTSWGVPYVGFGGSQNNVYFTLSHDRSLVAKLQNYNIDMALFVIPVFGMDEPWALFKRAEQ